MKKRIFGTDGIRGIAGTELTFELAMNIGKAIVSKVCSDNSRRKILVAKDTRLSSDGLEAAVTAGICSMGADVILAGVLPTPAICFLVKELEADAAIMISASHNSFEFNGIKIFNSYGFKLSDETEDELETLAIKNEFPGYCGEKVGIVYHEENLKRNYISSLVDIFEGGSKTLKIAIDCANGASYICAEEVFDKIGIKSVIINNEPDGVNINNKCGSTNISAISKFVVENECDCGFAYDGDADRCIAVSEKGEIIDGDNILAFCGLELLKFNKLAKSSVVGTPMSNLGMINFLKSKNINFVESKVGDRYILEEIVRNEYNFGGEQSGHIVFKDFTQTGDGILTSIMILNGLIKNNMKSSKILEMFEKTPQLLINVKLDREYSDDFLFEIKQKIEAIINREDKLFVRRSGTEPIIRVMLQSSNKESLSYIDNLFKKGKVLAGI